MNIMEKLRTIETDCVPELVYFDDKYSSKLAV